MACIDYSFSRTGGTLTPRSTRRLYWCIRLEYVVDRLGHPMLLTRADSCCAEAAATIRQRECRTTVSVSCVNRVYGGSGSAAIPEQRSVIL